MKTFARRALSFAGAPMIALVLVAACAGSADAASQAKKVAEKTFPFEANGEVVIESRNGRIAIETWDRTDVRVQITRVVRAADDKHAEELLKGLQADVTVAPGKIHIVSRYPKRRENVGLWDFLGGKIAAMDIHYYLQVPKSTALRLETSNGEIQISGATRSVEASTTNGDVKIMGGSGSIDAETTNGELEIQGVSGDVSGRTTNGSVRAEIRSLGEKGSVELETTNGNVTVSLPAAIQATVSAATTNGKVTSSFPLTMSGAMSSKSIQGTIGGGDAKGAALSFATTNGNIEILKIGERGEP
ncbi:MAG TPA: DUF4097 family beta strand repeat-containing protein [Candidatus Eisenbacteria bacterium]|nr:DUF4097 family beta strand repeat-containing protein [Candidatus Eisenbacteria bacterium]